MKYVIRRGQQMLPKGGHHFDAHGRTFKGEDHEEVIEQLKTYRINNMIPVGNPEQEVLASYASHSPWMVTAVDESPAKIGKHYSNWRDWVHSMWKNALHRIVTRKEASIRWEICCACKHNLKLEVSKSDEGAETLRRVFLLRRGQDVPKELGFCSLHLWDNSIACFLEDPLKASRKSKDSADQPKCWVLSSLTEP